LSSPSEKLRKLAELNFCKDCYFKYLALIHPEIDHILSEPISDWRQTEHNIDILWIKAKGLYDIKDSQVFSPHKNAFQKAENEKLWVKLKFLKEKGILQNFTYKLLDKVSKKRNKIHSLYKFSEKDYRSFRLAKAFTDALITPIIFDLQDEIWKKQLANNEELVQWLLENTEL
jgi:hypothetical protein